MTNASAIQGTNRNGASRPPRTRRYLHWAMAISLLVANASASHAQTPDSSKTPPKPFVVYPGAPLQIEMPEVVVTALRGERQIRNVPVPVEVVTSDDIKARGSRRLSDVLAEIAGLRIIHEFGAGVQMQGLNSDYVLVLLDGEPVVGRSGGTLDLDRLTVQGLERVEIVRGPSSSLYGSDALAGVINLISAEPSSPFAATVGMRYETHATADLTASSEFKRGQTSGVLLFDRYSSNGYDLFPDRPGRTVPGFVDYTGSARFGITTLGDTAIRLSARYGRLDQKDDIGLSYTAGGAPIVSIGERSEWSGSAVAKRWLSNDVKVDMSAFVSRFLSTTSLDLAAVNAAGGESRFDQVYGESEVKVGAIIGTSGFLTGGAGVALERVDADRVVGQSQASTAAFAYAQHEWQPSRVFRAIVSSRYDAHSDYQNRLSPKASFLYKGSEHVHVRASVGSGFKAPTFQQRYLDFSNPIGGYSVIGASGVGPALDELESRGEIRRYTNAAGVGVALRPEHSWSFNVGSNWYASASFELRVNLFYNRIGDLIETLLVAEQVGGQQIFSYANLDRIRTRGIEINGTVAPVRRVRIDFGYHYLDTADLDVLDALRDRQLFKRVDGRDRVVEEEEYGGLFQRSRHSGSVNFRFQTDASGLTASVRATYRGRYGLFDRNGNLVLDDDSEYVNGYVLLNGTVTKRLLTRLSVQVGVRNLFDYTNVALIPSLPGRLVFAGIELSVD